MQEISVISSSPSPIGPVVDDPLGQFLAGQRTERTRKAYLSDLRQFFGTGAITSEDVRGVTFSDIVEYRNGLAALGRRRATINRKLSSLKAFFKMMTAAGVVDKNPADTTLVKGYRLEEILVGKAIHKKSLQRIFDEVAAVDDDLTRTRDLAIFHVMLFCGLRRSEVANMAWSDLVQDGAFTVLRLPNTKSGVPQDVKIQSVVVHFLELYRDTLLKNGYPAQDRIFISLSRNDSHGKPLTDQSINLIVRKYSLSAGLDHRVTAHMLRHTCCTLSIEGGAKPQQVQAHLRHKDLKTTMRYYENREKLTDNASDYIRIS